MAPLDGSRKKRFMSHFSLTANTPVFFQSNEIVGNGTKMLFLFGFHLTSSTFNGFVNHFAVSKKNEHLRKLNCTPARWRLLQLGLFLILFPEGRFSATALPGGCPVPARPLRLPLRLLLPLLLLPARRWCSRARVERRELVT